MDFEYESNYEITYTEVNQNLEMTLTKAIDIVTDYFVSFGSDNKTVKEKKQRIMGVIKNQSTF